jgi:hypothetical protein
VPHYIEWLLRKVSMPEDHGRMMLKASQRLTKLTAREWITWTVVLSQAVMRQIPKPKQIQKTVTKQSRHMRSFTLMCRLSISISSCLMFRSSPCPSVSLSSVQRWCRVLSAWDSFVEGVRLLLSYSITIDNVNRAHKLFRAYCIGVEAIWGADFMKPNHHHLMHIKQCVLDYGPPHVFWVFAFERSNGLLSSYHSSMRTVELEMMKRFIQQQMVLNQDEASLSTLALEHAQLIPSMMTVMRTDHESAQMYASNEPLPLVLQSAYNKSWYNGNSDVYPYPSLPPLNPLQLQQHASVEAAAVQPPTSAPAPDVPSWLARWKLYTAATPPPLSNRLSPPCINCTKLVNDISLLRSEDKEAAVAFMPSSAIMWRELRQ